MTQFAYHVQRRLVNKPSTSTYYHHSIPDTNYDWFHPKTLFTRSALNKQEINRVAKELGADAEKCHFQATIFLEYAPYNLGEDQPIRLRNEVPKSSFTPFLDKALLHHPSAVVRSLRRGSEQITASSFFMSFCVSRYAIAPYFHVRNASFPSRYLSSNVSQVYVKDHFRSRYKHHPPRRHRARSRGTLVSPHQARRRHRHPIPLARYSQTRLSRRHWVRRSSHRAPRLHPPPTVLRRHHSARVKTFQVASVFLRQVRTRHGPQQSTSRTYSR